MDGYFVIALALLGLACILLAYARMKTAEYRRGWREGYQRGWLRGKRDQGD